MNYKHIRISPQRLREARVRRLLSGPLVSKQVGISRQSLCQYEKGFASPTAETLARLCLLYEIDVRDVVELNPEERAA